jgi:hypothetical protein
MLLRWTEQAATDPERIAGYISENVTEGAAETLPRLPIELVRQASGPQRERGALPYQLLS